MMKFDGDNDDLVVVVRDSSSGSMTTNISHDADEQQLSSLTGRNQDDVDAAATATTLMARRNDRRSRRHDHRDLHRLRLRLRRSHHHRPPPLRLISATQRTRSRGTKTLPIIRMTMIATTMATALLLILPAAAAFLVPQQHQEQASTRRPHIVARLAAATTATPPGENMSSSSASDDGKTTDNNNNDNKMADLEAERDGEDSVVFPPPLSTMDRVQRAATFWFTAIPIVANYYGLISQIKLQEMMSGTQLDEEHVEERWNRVHRDGAAKLAATVSDLQGFYVKTAQIISSRQDLFPAQYTDALSGFTDNLDPMPTSLAKAVVRSELINPSEKFEDVFMEFDDKPLGAASVAQVHRAVLTEKYGGPREVAVKIQRPSIESKLLGDIANLKAVTKTLQETTADNLLPLDYYTVFCELEKQLAAEFDFVAEAVAMDRIYESTRIDPSTGMVRDVPVVMPRPVPGLVSQRVLVMDYLPGVPLSRAREEMLAKGIDPESPEAKLFGRRLLTALTAVFGRAILETGFFHADPHPGNIFVLEDGRIGLIDFGQVKQISGRARETLCKVMIALDENRQRIKQLGDEDAAAALVKKDSDDSGIDDYENRGDAALTDEDIKLVGDLALELGVELKEGAPEIAAAAVGVWLFDGTVENLPGGYDKGELSPNSPVKELKSFPQDLVLVGRSSILIKGLSNRLGVPHSLAREWAPIARQVLDKQYGYSKMGATNTNGPTDRLRFKQVAAAFRQWLNGRLKYAVHKLPSPVRTRAAALALRWEERKSRRRLTRKQRNP